MGEGRERGNHDGEGLEVKTRRDAAIILPLEQNFESFSDRGNGSQATHSRSYSDYS